MKPMLLALALLAVTPAFAQTKSSDKLPPANPLPPPESEEGQVLAPVNALFAALAARNGQAVLSLVSDKGGATVAVEKADGTRVIRQQSFAEFAAHLTPGPEKFAEKLYSPAVEIDGDIAMVWGSYTFTIDGKLSHCGTDHFSLYRENGAWKISHIAWTQRTTGCPQ